MCRLEANIEMDLKEEQRESMGYVHVAEDEVQ
jgi:hypothetical protein